MMQQSPITNYTIEFNKVSIEPALTLDQNTGTGTETEEQSEEESLFSGMDFIKLKFTMAKGEITTNPKRIHFKLDRSGSMGDRCKDGRTQMDHALHTLQNMVRFFAEHPEANVEINIASFDDKLEENLTTTCLTTENINEIIAKIQMIYQRGSTDIGIALEDTLKNTKERNEEQIQIFMTDGQVTAGEENPQKLKQLVDSSVTNVFIGFGQNHDANLLSILSSVPGASYSFVDAIERAGLVYGEILTNLMYKVAGKTTLTLENAEIYDYITNIWTNKLTLDSLISETSKTFYLRRSTTERDRKIVINVSTNQGQITLESETPTYTDLTNEIYRYKTQELLYDTRKKSEEQSYSNSKEHKKKLKDFLAELKGYMKRTNQECNEFLKTLTDDIYILLKTFGTEYGIMYSATRHNTQGRECSYNVTELPEETGMYRQNAITRQNATVFTQDQYQYLDEDQCLVQDQDQDQDQDQCLVQDQDQDQDQDEDQDQDQDQDQDEDEEDDDITQHRMGSCINTINRTPTASAVMRSTSAGTQAVDYLDETPETETQRL